MKRIDERDIMFSRMNYKKGSKEYIDYYSRNKDKEELDNELRTKWLEQRKKAAYCDPLYSPIVDSTFDFLADIKKYSEGIVNNQKVDINTEKITKTIKGLASYYGANLCGTIKMKDYHFYSYRGRNEEYSKKVDISKHKYGIVFAVEMEKEMINRAPKTAEAIEVTKGYVNTAIIGMILSYYIRGLGYYARNHMDGNYLVVAPLVAQDAGLGEIGRNGILITKKYGQRVRLGVVTTEITLTENKKKEFGINKFCEICNRCVKTCPGKAIKSGPKEKIDDEIRWQINQEKCFNIWTSLGTDCGVCLSACPFSQGFEENDFNRLMISDVVRKEILEKYNKKLGIRSFNKEPVEWMK